MTRHVRRTRWSLARRCWFGFGVWAAVSTFLERTPHYEKAVDLFFTAAVIVAAAVPAESRTVAVKVVSGLVVLQSTLAGVVAAVSTDEAIDLVAGAIVVGVIGFGLWMTDRRPPSGRHQRA